MKPRLRLVVDNGRRLPTFPNLSTSRWSKADIEHMVNLALYQLRDLRIDPAEKERRIREDLANYD